MNSSKPNTGIDKLYANERPAADFVFDDAVAAVFPDMIRRSVPGYESVVPLTGLIVAKHLPPGGRCYDLGCSLGAVSHAVLDAVGDRPCEVVAVDNAPAMLARARRVARERRRETRLRWLRADIRQLEFAPADAVVCNYTLQFLPPEDRLPLLRRIRDALLDTGVLVLAEKVAEPGYFEELHIAFKRGNGYTDLEVAQKRAALENVMRIDCADTHAARLREAGFTDVRLWFRCLNWCSYVARP